MLSSLRRPDGGISLRVRVLAALVVFAMVGLAAPLVFSPVLHWIAGLVW